MTKHKPTEKELKKMRALYCKGEKPRNIILKFPDVDITAVELSKYLSRTKVTKTKEKIKKRVEEKLIEDIAEQQAEANKKLIEVSNKIVNVIEKYLQQGQYNDFTTFNYGKLIKSEGGTLNTLGFAQVTKALADIQKVQRLALDMDKELEEKLPPPIININFNDDEDMEE